MRLDKLLSNLGYGSRKQVKKYIRDGLVTVNGDIVYDDDLKVSLDDEVIFLDESICYDEYEYLYFNKPVNCICANFSNDYTTVFDYLEDKYLKRGFFTVGRLDKDTSGVLLITNDGKLGYRLLSPKNNVKKRYYAEFDGVLNKDAIELCKNGLKGEDLEFKPSKLEIISSNSCILEITEGKYHQVKNMLAILGVKVTCLKRISFASINYKEDVKEGEYVKLTLDEINNLKEVV